MGYGDYSPPDDRGRVISVFFLLIGVAVVGGILNQYANYVIECIEANAEEHQRIHAKEVTAHRDVVKSEEHEINYKKDRLAQQWWSLKFSVAAVLGCVISGAVVMSNWMQWSWITAFYWAMVTSMTVGYGDLSVPNDAWLHWFITFYMLVSTMTVSISLGNVFEVFSAWDKEKKHEVMMKNLSLTAIVNKFTEKADYEVDENEFVLFMLQQTMGLNYTRDVLPFVLKFKELDVTGNGSLNKEDVELFAQTVERRRALQAEADKLATPVGIMKYLPVWLQKVFVNNAKVAVEDPAPRPPPDSVEDGNGKP